MRKQESCQASCRYSIQTLCALSVVAASAGGGPRRGYKKHAVGCCGKCLSTFSPSGLSAALQGTRTFKFSLLVCFLPHAVFLPLKTKCWSFGSFLLLSDRKDKRLRETVNLLKHTKQRYLPVLYLLRFQRHLLSGHLHAVLCMPVRGMLEGKNPLANIINKK